MLAGLYTGDNLKGLSCQRSLNYLVSVFAKELLEVLAVFVVGVHLLGEGLEFSGELSLDGLDSLSNQDLLFRSAFGTR